MSFQSEFDGLMLRARRNLETKNARLKELDGMRRDLTPAGYEQRARAVQDEYAAKRTELFAQYKALVATTREANLRSLRKLPAGVTAGDWTATARDVESAPVADMVNRAVRYGDRTLARAVATRIYDSFMENGNTGDLPALHALAELDPYGVGAVAAFEAEHGGLRSAEAKVMGPFTGL